MLFWGQVGVLFHITVKLSDFFFCFIKEVFNLLKPSGFYTYHQA
jgi:hypothetical protein